MPPSQVKIINLLQKLQAQVKEEGEAETNAYGKSRKTASGRYLFHI